MAERVLELFFRHKLLLTLPVVLGLALGIVSSSLGRSSYYATRAAIWVEQPTDLTGGSFTEFNPYITPAQNQAGAMRELLALDAFASGMVTKANESLTDPANQLSLGALRQYTYIYPGSEHVLYVEHHAPNPALAKLTVEAVVSSYADLYTAQIRDKATRAKAFYEEQLNTARKAFESATSALRTYISANPQLASVNLDNPPSTALRDFEFAQLVAAEQTARQNYDQLLEKFAESQISAYAVEGTIPNFLVMDQPGLPTQPVKSSKRSLVMPPMFGLAGGFFVSAIAFVVFWRLDRRIHLPDDLAFLDPDVPVMTLPRATAKNRGWPSKFVRVGSGVKNGFTHRVPAVVTE